MNIALFEAFFTGSHQRWAEEFKAISKHSISIYTLSGAHWKWRMHGAAETLFHKWLQCGAQEDLVVCTDMMDVAQFRALMHLHGLKQKVVVYFHENQIVYPWSPDDLDLQLQRDRHYGYINYTSALVADGVVFNSNYHKEVFLQALTPFLSAFPDHQPLKSIESIALKSDVLYPGIHSLPFSKEKKEAEQPLTLLWNHRWEYDKDPEAFYRVLLRLKDHQVKFQLIIVGEQTKDYPKVFNAIQKNFSEYLLHFGYVSQRDDYESMIARADLLPVTSRQDFYGYSVIEAMHRGVVPILPKRLAYPEYADSDFFYENENDLVERILELMENRDRLYELLNKMDVKHTAWDQLQERYDQYFSSYL